MKKLSILIPTVRGREAMLAQLLEVLKPQLTPETELAVCCDDGEMTIGAKRNKMIEEATGEFVVFIDDDDIVTDDYVQQLMIGLKRKSIDVVCVNAVHTIDGDRAKLVVDIPYSRWEETETAYMRGVQFRDAVRRELAAAVPYPNIRFGEDHAWTIDFEAKFRHLAWVPAARPTYFHLYRTHK